MLKNTHRKIFREYKQKGEFSDDKPLPEADAILNFSLMANRWILRHRTDFEYSPF